MNRFSSSLRAWALGAGVVAVQWVSGIARGADPAPILDTNPYLQQAKLVADDGVADGHLGWSTAISADGTTAVVGASGANVGGHTDQGAVYVFVCTGPTWIQQAKLVAVDGTAFDRLGYAVSLSSDGATIAAGATGADVGGHADQGAVYIFTRSGAAWTQAAKLTATDGSVADRLGGAVVLSGDGVTLVAGATGTDMSGNLDQGAAYAFTRSSAGWTQHAKLKAADGAAGDLFGASVALSHDGKTAVAGAYNVTVSGQQKQGAAYVFKRSRYSWPQQAKLTAADGGAYTYFGVSVAMSGDGTAAVVGSHYADPGARGAAYVYTLANGAWAQQAKLTAADAGTGDSLGYSVAMSRDGLTAAAGACYATVNGQVARGAAYIFRHSGAVWGQRAKLTANDGAVADRFGSSVALSGDGATAAAGAYYVDIGGHTNQGAAYIFAANTLQFQACAFSVPENAGCLTVTVTRANESAGTVGASYVTVDGTALAGRDYSAATGTLTWPEGDSSPRSIVIRILNRVGPQASRSFSVVLYNAASALLGVPAQAAATIWDVPPGPTIRANGATGAIAVAHPIPVTVTVEMNADIHAGTPVDWWCVACAHGGSWYYLDAALQWTPFSGDPAACHPAYQGPLCNLPPTPVLSQFPLPPGMYDFWFAVDYPMDGILDLGGQLVCDQVTVTVQ